MIGWGEHDQKSCKFMSIGAEKPYFVLYVLLCYFKIFKIFQAHVLVLISLWHSFCQSRRTWKRGADITGPRAVRLSERQRPCQSVSAVQGNHPSR